MGRRSPFLSTCALRSILTAVKRRTPTRNTTPAASEERQAILRAAFRLHLASWIEADPRIALRIMRLVEDIMRNPYSGIGKPEPLRHGATGAWSRRITYEHRIVYEVNSAGVVFAVARGHYDRR